MYIIPNEYGKKHPDDIIVKGLKIIIVYTEPVINCPYIPECIIKSNKARK